MSQRTNRRRRGFTLLEVLLVMAILIIMVSVVTVGYNAIQRNAKIDGARMAISQIEKACMAYQLDVGDLPNQLTDLAAQPQGIPAGKWRGPYMEQIPVDPWGNTYTYKTTTINDLKKPVITSNGQNAADPSDDISNIAPQQQ